MDRPDDIACHQCQEPLGYVRPEQFVYECPRCRALSQPGRGHASVAATAAVIDGQEKLDQMKRDFSKAVQPYLAKVWAGRLGNARYFPPDEPGVAAGPILSAALLVALALGSMFLGLFAAAPVCLLLALWLVRETKRDLSKKRAAYRALQTQHQADCQALLQKIYASLDSASS